MVKAATPLVRASSLAGRPVITTDGAASREVQDLVLGEDGRSIAALTLREPGILGKRHIGVVPIASVESIGPDAVVITSVDVIEADDREPAVCADVVGSRILTDAGVEIGKISDIVVETRRNHVRVEAVEVHVDGATRYLVLPPAVSVAGDVVVVPAGSERNLLDTPEAVAEQLAGSRA